MMKMLDMLQVPITIQLQRIVTITHQSVSIKTSIEFSLFIVTFTDNHSCEGELKVDSTVNVKFACC